ncbi:nicotinate phosphoribosyltransferase [Saitoella complicata NRRL Y-17804]|uniref:nicotinate phosphoribosyltransferase n=1 Tax=Saitoella complicata (strain BCRC 22490 / CBS 7301 / JCM 7358 / NBRC 10748 / NRRL Y-17804) TaxID=698492 RepID=UPI0008681388|nr:nicotinate phosphoribosyltransferase [Saitoella complicata NRRL Y-17804]ODQ51124.1 nicotinate phosphoribosyltransferase [Saitoella complicata NRRL Y-17804]
MSPPAAEGVHSLFDTDLYKLSMQAAVLHHFPDVHVKYSFTNRTSEMRLNVEAYAWLEDQVMKLGALRVSEEELTWLGETLPFLSKDYLEWLREFGMKPEEQVRLSFDEETRELGCEIEGLWSDTILYEVPILALVSEAYFKFVDTDWDHDGQYERAYEKGRRLIEAGCKFSEFGTRRRRDYETHEIVMRALVDADREGAAKGGLSGTSNVHLARKFGVLPVGTVAHEWFMAIAAITDDYTHANHRALTLWRETYANELSIALTDTFGTDAFLDDFGRGLSEAFKGVRQDSGDPWQFVERMCGHYRGVGVDPSEKILVFSDALTVEKAVSLKAHAEKHGIIPAFGIGTFLTNDFIVVKSSEKGAVGEGDVSKPMNIVIKLSEAGGRRCVKISDDEKKFTGDPGRVREVLDELGLGGRRD